MPLPLFPLPRQVAFDSNGDPINAGRLFFYEAGTTTKKDTYTTSVGDVANANPVVADSAGRFGPIFGGSGAYKVTFCDAGNDDPPSASIWSVDNVGVLSTTPAVLSKTASYAVLTTDGDDILVLVDATGGAVTITLYTAVGNGGKVVAVRKTDSSVNAVTIDPFGSQTIDGETTLELSGQYDTVSLKCDGTNWAAITTVPTLTQPTLAAILWS